MGETTRQSRCSIANSARHSLPRRRRSGEPEREKLTAWQMAAPLSGHRHAGKRQDSLANKGLPGHPALRRSQEGCIDSKRDDQDVA